MGLAMKKMVQDGYKMTEVGVVPEDWDICLFSEVADRNKKWSITGGPFGSNLKSSDYTEEGVQIVQLQNIGDGVFHDNYKIYTSEKKANELLSCNIYPGEIILSKMGDPVARACIIPFGSQRYLMASDGIRLLIDEQCFSKNFVFYYINSIYFRKRAFEVSNGSTRLRIGLPVLKKLLVIKPTKAEQTAIANALSDADALINSLEKLIEKKRAIKQGAMQELLTGRKRLPGFEKVTIFQETDLGSIPSDWEVIGLTDLVSKQSDSIKIGPFGSALKRELLKTTGFKVYGQENVYEQNMFIGDRYISLEHYRKLKSCEIIAGDFLISMMGTVGKCFIVPNLFQPGIMDSHLLRLRLDPQKLCANFLRQLFGTEIIKKQVKQLSVGGIMEGLSSKIIKSLRIAIPSITEQISIANVLGDMDSEIYQLETKLSKQKLLKQAMMQELLTGKTRLI